jgi:hypothetical protein
MSDTVEWEMQVGEFSVTVAKISVDAATPGSMARIIRVG